mgnify:CR=1 FL=1
MRQERLVPDGEEVRAGDPRRHRALGLLVPARDPVTEGALGTAREQRLVVRREPGLAEALVVVQLERLPRRARVGIGVGVTGRLIAINGKPPLRVDREPGQDGQPAQGGQREDDDENRPLNFSWRSTFPPANTLVNGGRKPLNTMVPVLLPI